MRQAADRIGARMAGWISRAPLGGQGVELLISLYLISCGLAWMAAGNGMAGIASYRIMLAVMPDDAWGLMWAMCGLAWIVASHQHWLQIRRLAAILATGILIWCAATFVLSNPSTALGWGLGALGIGAGCAALQIR